MELHRALLWSKMYIVKRFILEQGSDSDIFVLPETIKRPVPIFTKVRRRRLSRKRRRIVKIRSKWYSPRFVDVA